MITVRATPWLSFAALLAACHAVSTERGVGATCSAEAACAPELECIEDRCRVQCVEDADCETSCVSIGRTGTKYCALAGETGSDSDGGTLPGEDAGLGGTPAGGGADSGGVGGMPPGAGSGGVPDAGTAGAGSGGVSAAGAGGRGGSGGVDEGPDAAASGSDAGEPVCDLSQVGLRCGTCGSFACLDGELTCTGDVANECGGCAALTGQVGDPCGTCGAAQCAGANFLNCVGEHPVNACGGCATLGNAPGASCGTCGVNEFICDGQEATRCEGDTSNACGGCSTLADPKDAPCGSCNLDVYECSGPEATLCSGDTPCPDP